MSTVSYFFYFIKLVLHHFCTRSCSICAHFRANSSYLEVLEFLAPVLDLLLECLLVLGNVIGVLKLDVVVQPGGTGKKQKIFLWQDLNFYGIFTS